MKKYTALADKCDKCDKPRRKSHYMLNVRINVW